MAKIKGISRFNTSSFPSEVQPWIGILLEPLNEALDSVMTALKGRLEFVENIKAEVKEFEATHDVTLPKIKHSLNSVLGVILLGSGNNKDDDNIVTGFKWYIIDNNNIAVKVLFSGAGTTRAKVKFMIIGG